MKLLTEKQLQTIEKHLKAFNNNFQPIEILRYNKIFYVFQGINEEQNNWIYSADSIENINGWLYGTVQANNKILKTL
jgi:hypothetical protein